MSKMGLCLTSIWTRQIYRLTKWKKVEIHSKWRTWDDRLNGVARLKCEDVPSRRFDALVIGIPSHKGAVTYILRSCSCHSCRTKQSIPASPGCSLIDMSGRSLQVNRLFAAAVVDCCNDFLCLDSTRVNDLPKHRKQWWRI